jgi:hypothetical protein
VDQEPDERLVVRWIWEIVPEIGFVQESCPLRKDWIEGPSANATEQMKNRDRRRNFAIIR